VKPSELLSDESKWTKKEIARDKSGNCVHPKSSDAVCFCILGAYYKCESVGIGRVSAAVRDLFPERDQGIPYFNDHPETTFEDVRKVLLAAGL
jgi:hypothetical protein